MSEEDARARLASQPTRAERLEGADFVVDNSGDADHLAREVDRVWAALLAMPHPGPAPVEAPPAG